MAYCSIEDVKAYAGVVGSADDALLTEIIDRAQTAIETYTGRIFEATSDSTRRFTVGEHTTERVLRFDEDLAAITTLTTNADSSSGGTAISSSEYITMPRNETPYFGLKLLGSSSNIWTYTSDPEMGVTLAGKWAYSTSPPDDIIHACIRYAAYLYRQKDSQVFDVTAIPDAGVITAPVGIPVDVKMLLAPYVKSTLY